MWLSYIIARVCTRRFLHVGWGRERDPEERGEGEGGKMRRGERSTTRNNQYAWRHDKEFLFMVIILWR